MRHNKFRVWDKKHKEMSYAPNYLLSSDGLLHWQFGYESNLLDQDNFEVMFYTGQKNKDGKEIYDGDIIQTIYVDGAVISKFQVRWNSGWAKWEKVRDDGAVFSVNELSEKRKETLGNIYENPELMK